MKQQKDNGPKLLQSKAFWVAVVTVGSALLTAIGSLLGNLNDEEKGEPPTDESEE